MTNLVLVWMSVYVQFPTASNWGCVGLGKGLSSEQRPLPRDAQSTNPKAQNATGSQLKA